MTERSVLAELALQFGIISVVAIGGGNAVLPEMHRMVVETHGWMSSATFAHLYALAQAAPGPNIMVVTLIGWYVAGIPGALVSTAALTIPAAVIAFGASRARSRWGELAWYKTFERAVAPLTVGLVLASAGLLTMSTASGPVSLGITAAVAAFVLFAKTNPLIPLAAAAVAGVLGLV
jgi:chromate transporter